MINERFHGLNINGVNDYNPSVPGTTGQSRVERARQHHELLA